MGGDWIMSPADDSAPRGTGATMPQSATALTASTPPGSLSGAPDGGELPRCIAKQADGHNGVTFRLGRRDAEPLLQIANGSELWSWRQPMSGSLLNARAGSASSKGET